MQIKRSRSKENRFILSHREIVEAESAATRANVGKLNVSDVVTGKLRITSFSAFISGVDGLVASKLSHRRIIT